MVVEPHGAAHSASPPNAPTAPHTTAIAAAPGLKQTRLRGVPLVIRAGARPLDQENRARRAPGDAGVLALSYRTTPGGHLGPGVEVTASCLEMDRDSYPGIDRKFLMFFRQISMSS